MTPLDRWLSRVTRNYLLDRVRARRLELVELTSTTPGPSEPSAEHHARVAEALSRLDVQERELVAALVDADSRREAADALCVTKRTVYNRAKRLEQKLLDSL